VPVQEENVLDSGLSGCFPNKRHRSTISSYLSAWIYPPGVRGDAIARPGLGRRLIADGLWGGQVVIAVEVAGKA